ncbi:Putative SsDNA binding protein Ssb3 [Aspergillus calidoustus]|uniref:Putative SsDNA binding protein Ssb3 n=1 Tax=Aspergillus calidoustus TaxID=454130 RepID=A0A0U5FYH1_ASPCI|nr:Putative SsDNA binding protein Ssb3 [Aspergillus calidoustus]
MSLQTPRVLPSHLHAFSPSATSPRSPPPVRLLGTVTALRGDTASISCGSHGEVTLILKPDSHLQMGKLVEVVGKVAEVPEGGLGIKVLATTDWGNPADCDYKIYEKLVEVTHKLKPLFYDSVE